MSFPRHGEIYRPIVEPGQPRMDRPSLHRYDEFPAGYSLAGCAPAEPASASPAGSQVATDGMGRTIEKQQTVNSVLTACLSQGDNFRGRGQYGDPAMIMGGLHHGSQASQYSQRQLYPANLLIDSFSPDLYEHAASQHFPQLRKYSAFRAMMEQLLGAFAEFGNKCCVDIRQLTSLPPYTGDRSKDLIDCEGIVLFFLRETIAGAEPKFYIAAEHTGSTIVTSAYSSEVVARGPDEEIRHWLEKSREVIEKRWSDSRLRERIQRTLNDAEKLRDSIRQVELTYALSGRCKYIAD